MDISTMVLHGRHPDPLLDDGIADPIHLTTTFPREADGSYPKGYSYGRQGNPNRSALEETLARLDGGAECACFASGTAATMAVFQSLSSGDHALVPRDGYYGNRMMLKEIFPRWGLSCDFIDMTELDLVRRALRPNTKLIWVETPSNPLMRVVDIAGVAAIAKAAKITLVVDNTVPTAVLQRGIDLGADLVVYSTTKFINGHSDLLGGAVVAAAADNFFSRIRGIQVHGGAVPSPFDCWLALRGVRTLPLRVRAQSASALTVATYLSTQPQVSRVHYAGLPWAPGHEVCVRQMKGGFGGLLAFEVRGGEAAAFAVAGACRLIRRATSLGGVETVIEHRASMEGAGTTVPLGLLRMSVGLESPDDLISDLSQALEVARA